jgi:hypothetical protein
LEALFAVSDRVEAERLLVNECGQNLEADWPAEGYERLRLAALKLSGGDLAALRRALKLAKTDWRDLLMLAGFGHDTSAHLYWAQGRS